MIADVKDAILKNFDPNTLVLQLQDALEKLKGKDASFEFVTPSSCQTLALNYRKNITSEGHAVIFVQPELEA